MSTTTDPGRIDVPATAEVLRARIDGEAEVLVVLGSGLAGLAHVVDEPVTIEFSEVPGYPATGVAGHAGRYVFGHLEGKRTLIQVGRFHAYEGHAMDVVVAPMRVAASLGIGTVFVTNAAGGITLGMVAGSLVLLDDHINLMHSSPLAGPVQDDEGRFPDMSQPYDATLQKFALQAAFELGIPLLRGTYAGVLGPSYETPAEVRMLASLGADLVGMSTVPEVITARALGLRVLGLSIVTNAAAGVPGGNEALTHEEVLEMGEGTTDSVAAIFRAVLRLLD